MDWDRVAVVVTGSRKGLTRAAARTLEEWVGQADVLVVGDAEGVDAKARAVFEARGKIPSVHVARWRELGRRAGPTRNGEMVAEAQALRDQGYRVRCIAFPGPVTKGTLDCVQQLTAAGFAVDCQPGGLG